MKSIINLIAVILIYANTISAQVCLPQANNATNQSARFYGQATIAGITAESTDKIIAYDSDGNVAGISDIVISQGNAYISLVIYGDDPNTPLIDEGMGSNDYFTLSIYDESEGICIAYPNSDSPQQFSGWANYNGAPIPAYSDFNEIFNFIGGRIQFDLTVFLEGPIAGNSMTTNLVDEGFFSLNQPYNNAPWYYSGTESVLTVPSNITDWIMVTIRSGIENTTVIDTIAALLQNDGKVVNTEGEFISFDADLSSYDSVFVAVYHRNHLAIMTASPVLLSSVSTIDFRSTPIYGGNGASANIVGLQALWAGDIVPDGIIDASDRSKAWNDKNMSGYLNSDVDISSTVDASDRSQVWNHRNLGSLVP